MDVVRGVIIVNIQAFSESLNRGHSVSIQFVNTVNPDGSY
jgi:hypothetical protein